MHGATVRNKETAPYAVCEFTIRWVKERVIDVSILIFYYTVTK